MGRRVLGSEIGPHHLSVGFKIAKVIGHDALSLTIYHVETDCELEAVAAGTRLPAETAFLIGNDMAVDIAKTVADMLGEDADEGSDPALLPWMTAGS